MSIAETFEPNELASLLKAERENANAPGCAAAIWYNGAIFEAADGFAHALDNMKATTRTAFAAGSVTKPFTATLIMQLMDEGRLNVRSRITDLLPELRLDDRRLAQEVTIRHLLNHTSGIDGDFLVDSGEGDDYLARAVELAAGTTFIHTPGMHFSYCNLGYILLGRIVEKLRGESFDTVLRRHIFEPLRLETASTALDDTSARPLARGHVKKGENWELVPPWPRSNTPCGSRLAMAPGDLVKFGAAHMQGGTPVVSRWGANAMQTIAVETATTQRCRGWGLGWMRFDWQGSHIFGHDGGVAGCATFLRIAPHANFAVALSINGGSHAHFYRSMMHSLMRKFLGIDAPPPNPKPVVEQIHELDKLEGRFERRGLFATVRAVDGSIEIQAGGDYGDPAAPSFRAFPSTPPLFVAQVPGSDSVMPFYFLKPDSAGRPVYLHFQDRLYKRVP